MTTRTRSANIGGTVITSTGITLATGTDLSVQSNASFAQANAARDQANAAYGQANTARADSNSTFATINTTFATVNTNIGTVYAQANAARSDANTTFATLNTSAATQNTNIGLAYDQANNARSQANTARDTANSAYNTANTKLGTSGGSISGDLTISGNLVVQGNATTINVSNLSVNDSIILLSANSSGDAEDIGFVGHITRGATNTHVGLIRKATENRFYLFDNYEVEPTNNVIDIANNNFRVANIRLNTINANSFVTVAGLDVTGQANAAYGQANAARSDANTTFATINTTFGTVNTTFGTVNTNIGTAYTQANNAYAAANNRVLKAGDTMTGNLIISAAAGAGSGTFAGGVSLLRVQGSTSAWSEPRIDLGELSLSPTAYIASKNEGSGGGSLIFGNRDTSSATSALTERMRITSIGNVGIGTNAPTNFGGTNLSIHSPSNSTYASTLWVSGAYVMEALINEASAVMSIGSRSNHKLDLCTNDTTRVTISNTGTVTSSVDFRAPIFYDSNNTSYYVNPADGGFNMRGGTSNRVTYSTNDSGIRVDNAEGSGGSDLRLGAAWGYNGVYHGTNLYLSTGGSATHFLFSPGTSKGYIDSSGNMIVTGSHRAPIFYDSDDTNSYYTSEGFVLRSTSPTIYFRDTDHNSAMLHCNSNILYVLRGGNDTTSWSQVSGQWPFYFGLADNSATCGGNFSAVGNVTAYASDLRLKENLRKIDSAVDKVKRLNGYHFDWVDKVAELGFTPDCKENDVGLIAQEVEAVMPQAVAPAPFDKDPQQDGTYKSKSGENYITINYDKLVPLLVEAIKEQNEKIEKLEAFIKERLN